VTTRDTDLVFAGGLPRDATAQFSVPTDVIGGATQVRGIEQCAGRRVEPVVGVRGRRFPAPAASKEPHAVPLNRAPEPAAYVIARAQRWRRGDAAGLQLIVQIGRLQPRPREIAGERAAKPVAAVARDSVDEDAPTLLL